MAQVVHSDILVILVECTTNPLNPLDFNIFAALKDMFTLKPGKTDEIRLNSEDSDEYDEKVTQEATVEMVIAVKMVILMAMMEMIVEQV